MVLLVDFNVGEASRIVDFIGGLGAEPLFTHGKFYHFCGAL